MMLPSILLAAGTGMADARLTLLIVTRRETVAPVRQGAPAYEILCGHYEGEINANAASNRIITDLA